MNKFIKYIPTLFPNLDLLLGQNKRDLDGNLIDIQRGMRIGDQYGICAAPSVGKTALTIKMISAIKHFGYPIHEVAIYDLDGNPLDENRLTKLTNLTPEERAGWFNIRSNMFMEDMVKDLNRIDAEYKAKKYKPVEVQDIITGEKKKMMPITIIVVDTVTSMKSSKFSLGGDSKADAIANQQGMTEGRLKGDICNSITNLCDSNIIVIWLAHLKKNVPEMGKTIAKKAYKSAPVEITDHFPDRFRQKLAGVFWMIKPEDGNNLESNTHPAVIYGYKEGAKVYSTSLIGVKTRSSTENRVSIKMFFENGTFDPNMSLLDTCAKYDTIISKAGGQYPSADNPSLFKDYKDEYKISRKDALKFTNPDAEYTRPFNLHEARYLVNYNGDDETIMEAKVTFLRTMLNELTNFFRYELECNNTTHEEIAKNKTSFHSIYSFMNNIKQQQKMSSEELTSLKAINKPITNDNVEIGEDNMF